MVDIFVSKLPEFIVILKSGNYVQNVVKLPERLATTFASVMPKKVWFRLPNGRQFDVKYSQEDHSFVKRTWFLKEVSRYSATILIFKHEDLGQFMYFESTGKISDLLELVNDKIFERKDFMLLTYRGFGKFDTVIFDSSKIEKLPVRCSSRNDVNEELEGGIAEIGPIVDMNIKEEADDAAEIPEAGMQEEEEIFDMDIEGEISTYAQWRVYPIVSHTNNQVAISAIKVVGNIARWGRDEQIQV
ncbi:hypothetical protein AgCh_018026 [Apium graveolens]